ncbi:ribonuclease H-like domain-containing protein [Alteribacillus sp. JSM 102045]|uniref:ribonuclease H-like domain-containing protein n=1 Tax=Alteribacillus sp. JSM 102045 TaxID=1562101 RepID=UPI0035C1E004
MKLKNKLNRMKHHLGSVNHSQSNKKENINEQDGCQTSDIPYAKEWEKLNASARFLEDQYMVKREVIYPFHHAHGKYRLEELYDVWEEWGKETAFHPLHPENRSPEDLLFFDTETTGLNSGAGNMIFLLGGAQFTSAHVKVSQFFLPGPEAEVALYHHFLRDTASTKNLVTYNGKAFDWPQLKTRHTFVRNEVPKLPPFGHFDLLHAARRLFKHRLSSCKLSVVEKEILQFERIDDTPGYLAPMLYFDFLNEKHPEYIEGVLTHNEWDVLSLITLYIDLSKRVLRNRPFGRETYEIGRWYAQCKEWEKASWCFEKALETIQEESDWQEECLCALGFVYKKLNLETDSMECFIKVVENNGANGAEAAIELAKFYEHRKKDPEKALSFVLEAVKINGYANQEINKRIIRLQQKIGK